MQLVHLEPVERAELDRLDEIRGLEPCLLFQVAADERGALEHDVVKLTRTRDIRAARAHKRAVAQPVASQHGIARCRDRDDDVLLCRVAMRLRGLRADALAERAKRALRPAVRDDALDRRKRRPDARDLRLRLTTAADDAERRCAAPSEILRGDRARCARAQTSELVRLDDCDELGPRGVEQRDHEGRSRCEAGVHLRARVPELEVRRGHVSEPSLVQPEPSAWRDLDGPTRHALEGGFDRRDRVNRGQQRANVVFAQVERHA